MTDHKDRRVEGTDAAEGKFEARRRLLKASAAAPLIATLSPNAAFAALTSVSCDEKNLLNPSLQATPEFIETPDAMPDGKGRISNDPDKAVRKVISAKRWTSSHPTMPGPDLWEIEGSLYEENGDFVDTGSQSVAAYLNSNQYSNFTSVNVGVVGVFDTSIPGDPMFSGFWPEKSPPSVLAGSCWASLDNMLGHQI